MRSVLTFFVVLALGLVACQSPSSPSPADAPAAPISVSSVTLDASSGSLAVGGTKQLTATVLPANATNKQVSWSTNASGVASVSASGLVTAQGLGQATIQATTADGGKTASYVVDVIVPVSSVLLNKSATNLAVGETETLHSYVLPANASDRTVTWSSDATATASVDPATGVVTGVAVGTAHITATTNQGSKIAAATVNVVAAPVVVTAVALNKATTTIVLGSQETLYASFTPTTATNQTVTWDSSAPTVATVDNGFVTPLTVGTTTITVHSGSYSAQTVVTVVSVPVTGVDLTPATATVNVGQTTTLTATVSPNTASNKNVTWTTNDAGVATVVNGVVTGVGKGTANITVTTVDGSFTDVTVVTVKQPVTGITLNVSSLDILFNQNGTLVATVQPPNANNQTVTWTSSASTFVAVSNGTVTGWKLGTATITATTADGSFTASATVRVQDLLINEVVNPYYYNYSTGIEIYNPTSVALNLSAYSLRSGAAKFDTSIPLASLYYGQKTFTLPPLVVPSHGYVVIRSKVVPDNVSGGNTIYLNDGIGTYPYYPCVTDSFDSIELLKGGSTVDFVRWGTGNTTTPTTNTVNFTGLAPAITSAPSYAGYSWNRSAANGSTFTGSDWTVRAWSTLGGPNDVTADTDADGDGIPDSAETSGGKFAGLDLYAWGARTGQKDIFIHIDYMDSTDPGVTPRKEALDKVVAAFAAKGYVVHFDVGDLFGGVGAANDNLDGASHKVAYNGSIALGAATNKGNVYQYKVNSMPLAKSKVFFYMLFADTQSYPVVSYGSSGIANLPGNTSIITLGHWSLNTSTTADTNTLINFQAATMMHEFGHNLGLKHGGNDSVTNYKPNYFSVMNYLYQLDGLPVSASDYDTRYYAQYQLMYNALYGSAYAMPQLNSAWTARADKSTWSDSYATSNFQFSYSDGSGSAINEAAASESAGLGRSGSAGIDFNNNGSTADTTNISLLYILDPNVSDSVSRKTLTDFNDWAVVSTAFQRTYSGMLNGAARTVGTTKASTPWFVDAPPTTSEPCVSPFAVKKTK